MTREEIRQYVLDHPMQWKPLSDWQRAQLAVILRPDLPQGDGGEHEHRGSGPRDC
jgi:hypothetical protein